jgi:arginase
LQAHFFKLKSRFGLLNPPIGKQELNIGVEDAPDAILSADFLRLIGNAPVDEYSFPVPQDINADFSILVKSFTEAKNLIKSKLTLNETQVVIGGDHSVTFAAVLALFDRIKPSDIGYIQIDSHGDMNLYAESPTKNFHGMYLRPVVGNFDVPQVEALIPNKLPPQNMWFVGNLDLDPAEADFFKQKNIKNTTKSQIQFNPGFFRKELADFATKFQHLHVSLDVDGLDQSIIQATGLPARNGLFLEHVYPIIDIIKSQPSISFDLVEVNPSRPGAQETIKVARNLLLRLL